MSQQPEPAKEQFKKSLSRRRFIVGTVGLGLSATALGSLLAACGDNTPTQAAGTTASNSGANPTTGQNSPAGSTNQVTIRYAMWPREQLDATNEIVQKFKALHPNIDVKVELTPPTDYWTKLQAAATGKTLPDVFMMNPPNFVTYSSNGQLLALNDMISGDKLDLSVYPKALIDAYKLGDKSYGFPRTVALTGLWYNKKLFDDAGVKYPDETWDWTTIHQVAQKLTDPSKGVWGIAAPVANQTGFYNTIFQSDGFVISPDGKTSGYDNPATIEGLKFWTDFIKEKSSPSLAQMTETTPQDLFQSGKVAMLYDGNWQAVVFSKNQYLGDKLGVAILPKGKKRVANVLATANSISARTEHPKEAWEFLKFLSSQDANTVMGKTGTVLPPYQGTGDFWVKQYPSLNVKVFVDQLTDTVPYPTGKDTPKWQDLETKLLGQAWSGSISIDDAAKQLAQQMNKILQG
jgi:multiple sugar transport system substrate-binding protein